MSGSSDQSSRKVIKEHSEEYQMNSRRQNREQLRNDDDSKQGYTQSPQTRLTDQKSNQLRSGEEQDNKSVGLSSNTVQAEAFSGQVVSRSPTDSLSTKPTQEGSPHPSGKGSQARAEAVTADHSSMKPDKEVSSKPSGKEIPATKEAASMKPDKEVSSKPSGNEIPARKKAAVTEDYGKKQANAKTNLVLRPRPDPTSKQKKDCCCSIL